MQVLICSKDPAIRQAAADALAKSGGFTVRSARDGHEALDHLDLAKVELVVLDVDHGGKDMWDLVEWLLDTEAMTALICLSSVEGGAAWTRAPVADVTLAKPLDAARLLAAVRQVVTLPAADRLKRNSQRLMGVRYARPYVPTAPLPAARYA